MLDMFGNLIKPHHPVINPQKPEKLRRVCHTAAKYQGVALNDKFLSGPDLMQSLIAIIFRFREHQIAISADMEAMFLQVAVSSDDSRCLRFLWREDPEQRMEVYEYPRNVFGKKSRRFVQITLCTKWRKVFQSTTKVSSERFSETSTWSTSSIQSEPRKKKSISTRKSETSSSKVDSNWLNGQQVMMKSSHKSQRQRDQQNFWCRATIIFISWTKL